MKTDERLAIIRTVRFGLVDGRVMLRFSAYTEECSAAIHYLEGAEIETVIRDSQVSDIRELERWPCIVSSGEPDGRFGINTIQHFVRVWKRFITDWAE